MVGFYFEKCAKLFDEDIATFNAADYHQKINNLIVFGLGLGESLTKICKIFRELWAVAAEFTRKLVSGLDKAGWDRTWMSFKKNLTWFVPKGP
jgi:hypothetical protein